MNKIVHLFIVVMSISSCQGQQKNTTKNKQEISSVKNQTQSMNTIDLQKTAKHIELQDRVFIADHTPDNEYIATQEDLDLQLPLLEISLTNSGYKFPGYSLFRERIKSAFGIDIDKSEENIVTLYYDNPVFFKDKAFTDEEIKNIIKGETNVGFDFWKYNFMVDEGWNLFIDKQRRIITPMLFLGDLINIKNLKTGDYSIKQDLKTMSLNKLIMYDDKASTTYLLARNYSFTAPLLTEFNYDKSDGINKAVMDSLYTIYKNNGYRFGRELTSYIFEKEY